MKESENKCLWIETNPNNEEIVYNQFEEFLLLNMCRVYEDKQEKKEIEPLCFFETEETTGTDRKFFFTINQLSKLIVQLSAMRNKMIKHTEKLFDERFGIKPQPKKKTTGNNPIKGDDILKTIDSLFKDFAVKPNNKPQQNNDNRRKGKGKRTH